MHGSILTPFEQSLMENLNPSNPEDFSFGQAGEPPGPKEEGARRPVNALVVRNQIDSFLGGAGGVEEIGALLLTVTTVGDLFAYNRAFLLLSDPLDDHIRGYAGIGSLSREETWKLWVDILSEKPDLADLIQRAVQNFREQNQRLAPLLDQLVVVPDQADRTALSFRGPAIEVLNRPTHPDGSEWLFKVLGTENVGIIPMWGYYGHFGVLIVDNFATGRPIFHEGIQLLEGFVRPFISALEKALVIKRYQVKVLQLQEAKDLIEAQQGMLLRMDRKNTVGRFTATLAHNLLNPVLSMSGRLARLSGRLVDQDTQERLLAGLNQDVRDLEEFLGDFIAQVDKEYPLRQFWDLNHLVREVVSNYHHFHNINTPHVDFREGEIPLIRLDYERVTASLSRTLGIVSFLAGGAEKIEVGTRREEGEVLLDVGTARPILTYESSCEDRIENEVGRLREYLSVDEIGLERGPGSFTLIFRL